MRNKTALDVVSVSAGDYWVTHTHPGYRDTHHLSQSQSMRTTRAREEYLAVGNYHHSANMETRVSISANSMFEGLFFSIEPHRYHSNGATTKP